MYILALEVVVSVGLGLVPNVRTDPVGTTRILDWQGGKRAALSIVFDDNGAGDTRDQSAVILEEYGMRGTFAIITGSLNEKNAGMFLNMHERGHELASHSVSHLPLNDESEEVIWRELAESKLFIESLTNSPCVSYVPPYGQFAHAVQSVAEQLYVAARKSGVYVTPLLVAGSEQGMFRPFPEIGLAPLPSMGETWEDSEFLAHLREYIERVIDREAWGVEMWHELNQDPGVTSSQLSVNPWVLRGHFADLVSGPLGDSIWVAPLGTVARYYIEREHTVIRELVAREDVIIIDMKFDGDSAVYDVPVTVQTVIPDRWRAERIEVRQDEELLDFVLLRNGTGTSVVYAVVPTDQVISLIHQPPPALFCDFNSDGIVDLRDLAFFAQYWLGTAREDAGVLPPENAYSDDEGDVF